MSNPIAFIIEDDVDTANIFSAALQTAGFETQSIHDGQQAKEQLFNGQPDIVVLDLHLPNISGYDLLMDIRKSDHLSNVPVILATADQRLAEELESNANIILIKPVSFNQLSILSKRLYQRYASQKT